MDHIAEAINQAQAYLRDHPDEARYPDSNATAVMGDGLLCTVTGPSGASMQTDMPASVGGSALAAPPGWYMRAAAASCWRQAKCFWRGRAAKAKLLVAGSHQQRDPLNVITTDVTGPRSPNHRRRAGVPTCETGTPVMFPNERTTAMTR